MHLFLLKQVASALPAYVGTLARFCRCRASKNHLPAPYGAKCPLALAPKHNVTYGYAVCHDHPVHNFSATCHFRTCHKLNNIHSSFPRGCNRAPRCSGMAVSTHRWRCDAALCRIFQIFSFRAWRLAQVMPFLLYVSLSIPAAINSFLILCIDLGTEIGPALSFAWEAAEV